MYLKLLLREQGGGGNQGHNVMCYVCKDRYWTGNLRVDGGGEATEAVRIGKGEGWRGMYSNQF